MDGEKRKRGRMRGYCTEIGLQVEEIMSLMLASGIALSRNGLSRWSSQRLAMMLGALVKRDLP